MTFVAWAAANMAAPQVYHPFPCTAYLEVDQPAFKQIFQSSDAPRYRNGFTAHFCLYKVTISAGLSRHFHN